MRGRSYTNADGGASAGEVSGELWELSPGSPILEIVSAFPSSAPISFPSLRKVLVPHREVSMVCGRPGKRFYSASSASFSSTFFRTRYRATLKVWH